MYVLTIDNDLEKLRHVVAKVEWPMLTANEDGDPARSLFLNHFCFVAPLWLQLPARSASLRIDVGPDRAPVTWHGLTTAADSALGRQAMGALMCLDGVEGAVVTCPANLEEFNNAYVAGPEERWGLDTTPLTAVDGLLVFDTARIFDRLSALLTSAVKMGHRLSYQALFKPGRPDRALIARTRKAAAALRRHPYVPRSVANAQEAVAASLEKTDSQVEEAVSTSEDGKAWLRHWLSENAASGHIGLADPRSRPPVALSDIQQEAFANHIHPDVLLGEEPVADDASLVTSYWSDTDAAELFRCEGLWRRGSRPAEPPQLSPLPLFFGGPGRPPPVAPGGVDVGEPFYFVSYAHKDIAAIRPILDKITGSGSRIWIDEQIPVSEEWDERLETMITKSAGLLVFLSPSYVASKHCRRELKFADALDKTIYAGALTEFPRERGLGYIFASLQYARGSADQIAVSLLASMGRTQKETP